MESFIAQPNNPRICQNNAIGLVQEGNAVSVLLACGRANSHRIVAATVLTPAEARDKALKLWQAAEEADRAMNAALLGGKEGM